MTDRDIIIGYREHVVALDLIFRQMNWNRDHRLPVLDLPEHADRLKGYIIRFEDILNGIPDRRTQIILRCRFALGMTARETAEQLLMNHKTINAITAAALNRLP